MQLFRSVGFVTLGLALLAGCGGGPKLVPVEGTVTLDGQPLKFKSLSFAPETPGGTTAGGNTDEAGKYKLIAVIPGATTDQVGVPAGKYKVTVFEPLIPIGKEIDTGTDSAPGPGLVPELTKKKSEVPPVYQNLQTTPLVVEVPEAGGTLNLELKSKP